MIQHVDQLHCAALCSDTDGKNQIKITYWTYFIVVLKKDYCSTYGFEIADSLRF